MHSIQRGNLNGTTSVDLSADGQLLYAGAFQVAAETIYRPNKTSGTLEHVKTVQNSNLLNGVTSLRAGSDGAYAVSAAFRSNAILLYLRNMTTGEPTQLDLIRQDLTRCD